MPLPPIKPELPLYLIMSLFNIDNCTFSAQISKTLQQKFPYTRSLGLTSELPNADTKIQQMCS